MAQPVAEHAFACAACSAVAGVVRLFGPAERAEIARDSVTSRLTLRVDAGAVARVQRLIEAGDIAGLYEFDLEVASFYCPACRSSYCGDHWARRDVFDDDEGFTWHDSIRGRCPRGHERMLED
jgi:hypothetical protein